METENAIIIALIILILGAAAVAFIITESGVSFNHRADDLNMSVKVNNTTETINFTDDVTDSSSSSSSESGTVASSSSGSSGYSNSHSSQSSSSSPTTSEQESTNPGEDSSYDFSDVPNAGQDEAIDGDFT